MTDQGVKQLKDWIGIVSSLAMLVGVVATCTYAVQSISNTTANLSRSVERLDKTVLDQHDATAVLRTEVQELREELRNRRD